MSEENVEVVRRIYEERLLDRDPKRLVDDFSAPDLEYVEPLDDVDPGSRRGRREVLLALRRARHSFTRYRHELHELFDAGDTVVVAVTFRAHRGKREDIEREEGYVWTFRDAKIIRFENGPNLKETLEAAGLSKWAMSEENVEAWRQVVDAAFRGDRSAFMALCEPDYEVVPPLDWPEGAIRGREAAWDFYARIAEAFEP